MAGKIIGAVMIIAACAGFGYRLSLKGAIRRDELTCIKNIISNIMSNLEFGRMTFEEAMVQALENIEENEIFDAVLKSLRNNNSIRNAWRFAFSDAKESTYLTKEDSDNISRLGEGFSSGDLTLQKKYCDNIIKYIDFQCDAIAQRSIKENKLYRSVSITIGIFIVVLLI